MFRTVPLSIIRWFFTVHTAMVCVIQLASRIRTELQFILLTIYRKSVQKIQISLKI